MSETAFKDQLAKGVLQGGLQQTLQRAGTKLNIIALDGQPIS